MHPTQAVRAAWEDLVGGSDPPHQNGGGGLSLPHPPPRRFWAFPYSPGEGTPGGEIDRGGGEPINTPPRDCTRKPPPTHTIHRVSRIPAWPDPHIHVALGRTRLPPLE